MPPTVLPGRCFPTVPVVPDNRASVGTCFEAMFKAPPSLSPAIATASIVLLWIFCDDIGVKVGDTEVLR